MTNEQNLTPEQEAEELKAIQAPEDEVRANIINEFGFDEDDDAERIDKLVAKEMEHSTKLSSAIGQKIKHRDKVKELETQLGKEKPPVKEEIKIDDDFDKKLDERLEARLEKKALDELEYSDELKEEIKSLAQLKKLSIKQVLKDPYILHRIEEYEKENKTDDASINRDNKRTGKKVFSMDNPPEVDMATEEGRKTWDDYLTAMKKAGN